MEIFLKFMNQRKVTEAEFEHNSDTEHFGNIYIFRNLYSFQKFPFKNFWLHGMYTYTTNCIQAGGLYYTIVNTLPLGY